MFPPNPCHNNKWFKWQIIPSKVNPGYYLIKAKSSGTCLRSWGFEDQTDLLLGSGCLDEPYYEWKLERVY
jgi:hypothetical protein